MSAANIDRAAILRDVCVVTAANIASYPQFASQFVLAHNVLSKLAGREIYIVTWPNGIAAMVDADPRTTGWDDLLVSTYAACLQNHVGPVGG